MSNFWSKRIKDFRKVADKINEDEEKVKELINGEREIKGETLDRVLKELEDDKIQDKIRDAEIWRWYVDTDLYELRKKFNYNQKQLATIIGIDNGYLCNLERKKVNKICGAIRKLYKFYSNDFNINIKKEKKEFKKINRFDVGGTATDKLRDFFEEFNFKEYMDNLGCSYSGFISNLGYKKAGGQQINALRGLEEGFFDEKYKGLYYRIYDFIKNGSEIKMEKNKKIKRNDVKTYKKALKFFKDFDLKEYMENRNLSKQDLVIALGYKGCGGTQTRTIGEIINHKPITGTKSLVNRLYDYIQDEFNRINKEELVEENIIENNEDVKYEVEANCDDYYEISSLDETGASQEIENPNKVIDELYKKNEMLRLENSNLKRQIMLYEKLIERL